MSAIIRVALSRKQLDIEPGQKGELSVAVQNLSEIVDQYNVEVEGLDAGWITLSPPRLSLFPQDEGQVTIKLHPPEAAKAGTYGFAVKVVSRENPVEWTRVHATLEVSSVFVFEVNLSPQRQSIVEGEATFDVHLTNPGNVDVTLNLSASDPEEALSYRFDPASVTIEAAGKKTASLTVSPKQAAKAGGRSYAFTVRAAPAGAPGKTRTVSGQLECDPRVVSLDLGLWPERRSAVGAGKFRVQLANQGNTDMSVTLEGTDPAEACAYKFEPAEVTLKAGESRQVPLTVAPFGQVPTEEPVLYDFRVKAAPRNAPHEAQRVSGQFECLPKVILFEMVLSPSRVSARDAGSFLVQLTNRGETDVDLKLSVSDASGACNLRLQDRNVSLKSGASKEISLRVAPKMKPPRGEARVCTFTVEAVPEGAPHLGKSDHGEVEIVRPKRHWLLAVGVVVVLAVMAVAVLMLLSDGGEVDQALGAEFWADPNVVPRGGCTILRWWVERPERVVIEGPGAGLDVPFDLSEVGVSPDVKRWDAWRSGENLEGELEVCPEEGTEYHLIVVRGRGETVLATFVSVE
ncbi:MAG: hypothetical protein PVJ55_04120 [Anaerolineae bacterium]|jgi:uncharacterized membrane protein